MTLNHSETPILHGGPLGTNHRETLLGGAVREGISLNHSETLLALA